VGVVRAGKLFLTDTKNIKSAFFNPFIFKFQKYIELQERNHKLTEQCKEQEKALEELGAQFGVSKLQVSELREQISVKSPVRTEVQWASDKEVTHCRSCAKEFNMTRRKVGFFLTNIHRTMY
jgi:hypothetical protein